MKRNNKHILKMILIFSITTSIVIITSLASIHSYRIVLNILNNFSRFDLVVFLMYLSLPYIATGFIVFYIAVHKRSRSVSLLCIALKKVMNGNFDVRLRRKHKNTDMIQLDAYFNRMVKKLNRMDTLHNNFMSNVSHELRTPLSTIAGYTSLLQNKCISDQDRMYYTNQIMNITKNMSGIVNNVLLLSRLEQKEVEIKKNYFNFAESIRRVILSLEHQWDVKNITFDLDLEEMDFYGNQELLEEAWYNIIFNAIKYTHNDDTIKIKLRHKTKSIRLTITDHGIGMDEQVQKRIFDKFYQADTSSTIKGSGLGLPLTKKIIGLHSGKISVKSKTQEGTSFTIVFSNQFYEQIHIHSKSTGSLAAV